METRTQEIAFRALVLLGTLACAAFVYATPAVAIGSIAILGVARIALRILGFCLQKEGFTHVRGQCKEKPLEKGCLFRLMSWNICGISGGMSLDHGGVVDWRKRFPAICRCIRKEDPDVLVLQEVYDTLLAERLIDELGELFAHFYIHLGPNTLGSTSGCMILSKYKPNTFSFQPFQNNDWSLTKGFATLVLKDKEEKWQLRVIGTHLLHGTSEQDAGGRENQVKEILDSLPLDEKCRSATLLAGDLNIEKSTLKPKHPLAEHFTHFVEKGPTASNRMASLWKRETPDVAEETIDYISLHKKASLKMCQHLETKILKVFDDTSPMAMKAALSDHHAILSVFSL